jgi:two-component system sensor histidine kinase FlrB
MAAPQLQRIQDLEHSFQVFNQVSRELEDTYHRLEARVSALHHQVQQNDQAEITAQQARRMRATLQALPAGVVVLDGTGRVQDANPAAVALLGEPLVDEVWNAVIARAFAPRSDDGHDLSLVDGRRVSIATCPLGDEPGQVLLFTDVTETRELQNRLSQHQRLTAMGEMAAGLAHQIRTPLASGLLYASQLKNAGLGAQAKAQIADKVVSQLRQLESLINDMLLFSRSGYGGDESIAVTELLDELYEAVVPHCRERNIQLDMGTPVEEFHIQGNLHILLSALLNLATNALQAMNTAGVLGVEARRGVCDTVEIRVTDTGPGIPEHLRDKLFQPFFTTRANGTGLGLSVVRSVAQAHGGSVRLESGPDGGSVFIVQLPLLAADDGLQPVPTNHSLAS